MRPQTLRLRVGLALASLSLHGCTATSPGQAAAHLPLTPIGIAPFELHNAHAYVRVQIADSVSGWFILDTGGSTTLDSAVATSLGRPIVRTETGYGGGEAPFAVRFIDGVQLGVVDAAHHSVAIVPPQRVASVDLSAVARAEGRPLAGILGGSFFARYAVVIDYDRRQVEVHRRCDYRGQTGWVEVPVRVQGDLVFARGTVTLQPGETPADGWYILDSGGGHALILNTPFVSRQGLVPPGADSADARIQGVGGGAPVRRGRVEAFSIGGVTLTNVGALFSRARTGHFSRGDFDGSVGGGLLTRFSGVAFDYSSRRIWLGPMRLEKDSTK